MLRRSFLFIVIILLAGCSVNTQNNKLDLQKDNNYPRWLKTGNYSTDQTSSINFIGSVNNNTKEFLLADDIGKLHHFNITNDTIFQFSDIYLTPTVQAYLDSFPKKDFEEFVYDKYTNNVYLSIEGNGKNFKNFVGIYNVKFNNNDVFNDTISLIKKINIEPINLFLKYTDNNIGYEGVAVDSNYLYLGLEGFQEKGIFADSTLLFIVDKHNYKIIKQINTKPLGIHTICGLYSDKNNSIYGIDRNNKTAFHFNLNSNLEIQNLSLCKLESPIPNYPQYDYVASLEGVSLDDSGNIYFVDDPWKTYFVPSQEILSKLDPETIGNFKKFVPVIFKYHIK